jgi:hypothetical protein
MIKMKRMGHNRFRDASRCLEILPTNSFEANNLSIDRLNSEL